MYDETTGELLAEPDLEAGYTYPGKHFVAHHEAVGEVSHLDVMPGTESMNGGKGLRGKVVDVSAKDAWDEYEDCLLYHAYTDEELLMRNPSEMIEKIVSERLASAITTAVALSKGG